MLNRTLLAGVITGFTLAISSPAPAIDIIDLHKNFADGTPDKAGNRFVVTGVVTMPDGVRSTSGTEVAIQDSTGGIHLFQSGGSGFNFDLADSVTIEGELNGLDLSTFRGRTELGALTNYTLHSTGNPEPEPLVITCFQLENTFQSVPADSFPELNEGRLIRINDVTVVAGVWPSTCIGLNRSLTIQDASGTATLFIDGTSEVCGSPNPSGTFDVIGILSQNFNGSIFDPWTDGYEIIPRFTTDVIPETPGPGFIGDPQAVDVDSNSARIIWTTEGPATSFVTYGTSTLYGSLEGDSALVTSHSIQLNNLTPGSLYHYRAGSSDVSGTRLTNDFVFVTTSTAPGTMNFYFSHSVDESLANPDTAKGNVDLSQPIIHRINNAQFDISVAVFSFSWSPITDALIAAWNRGVKVRLIKDANRSFTQAQRLVNEGIPVIESDFGGNHGGDGSVGIHHNKFFIFDTRDLSSNTDDWVWTSSTNISTNLSDVNNGVEIQNFELAQNYLIEFNEMWGSSTDTPNAGLSLMGSNKTDNTTHNFVINGIPVELYFSPTDGVEGQIVGVVNSADNSFYFAQSIFTSNPISATAESKHNGVPGFRVKGVFDAISADDGGSEYLNMKPAGGPAPWNPGADVHKDQDVGLLHHKYGFVDHDLPLSDPQVITGSHNWSNAAETVNDENTLIFHDAAITNLFLQEWADRYTTAGGTDLITLVAVGDIRLPNGLRLSAPRPNPTRSGSMIDFALPSPVAPGQRLSLRLYDTRGRLVSTLLDGPAQGGPQRVRFDGRDDRGQRLTSGIYFLRLNALGKSLTQKWVLLP